MIFIHEGDVHAAENVFQKFGGFGGATAGNGHEGFDCNAVNGFCFFQARGRVAANDFGDFGDLAVGVAGVFAFGRIGEVKIGAGFEAASGFENGTQFVFGGAGVSGGFENNDDAFWQMWRDGARGVEDVGKVGLAILVEGRGDADEYGVELFDACAIGGSFDLVGGALGLHRISGDVFDVTFAGIKRVDFGFVQVNAEHLRSGFGELNH
jgi:hypothetical protein